MLAVLVAGGCAQNEPSLNLIEGSEPQRIAFGAPKATEQAMVAKMKQCWMQPKGLLAGYHYDVTPVAADAGSGTPALEQIVVSAAGKRASPPSWSNSILPMRRTR